MTGGENPARSIRVVMHAHSEWSYDASWPLDKIARVMPRLGAQVVMMSEHDTGFAAERFAEYRKACAMASTRDCLIVPGIEYSDEDNSVHLPTWGLETFLGEARPTITTLQDVAACGGASVFAHPARRDAWEVFDPDWKPLLSGLEIWNRKTDGIAPGVEAVRMLEETGLNPVVGMDFHRKNQLWPLINRFAIEGSVNETTLVAALRAGRVTPYAFSRKLIGETGAVRQSGYRKAEHVRHLIKRHILRRQTRNRTVKRP